MKLNSSFFLQGAWGILKAFVLATFLLLVSCGQHGFQVFNAPKRKSEAGLLVKCISPSEALEAARSLSIQYRVLHEGQSLYEFRTKDEAKLFSRLPMRARVRENTFYQLSFKTHLTSQFSSNSEVNAASFDHLTEIDFPKNIPRNQLGLGQVVAVIDTGIDPEHPHLKGSVLAGKDFVYGMGPVMSDDNGHGTHVSGLIVGEYSGVAPGAKVLPVKVLNHEGQGDLGTILAGVLYAIDQGVDVINMSLGSESKSMSNQLQALLQGLENAQAKNINLVFAAGNGGDDFLGDCSVDTPNYPSSFSLESKISVASLNHSDLIAGYSNYGPHVDLAAPGGEHSAGQGILSTTPSVCKDIGCDERWATYRRSAGTSMAAPIVAGALAIVRSLNPQRSSLEYKEAILEGSEKLDHLRGVINSGGRLSIQGALDWFAK